MVALIGLWSVGDRTAGIAAPGDKAQDGKRSDEPVRAFLARHCQECHRGTKAKGKFKLEQLAADPGEKASRRPWLRMLEQLKAKEMPPKEKPRPAENEVKAVTDWVLGRIAAAEAARRKAQGRVAMRGSTGWNTRTRSATCSESTSM